VNISYTFSLFPAEKRGCARTKLAFNTPKDGRGIGQSSTDVLGMYNSWRWFKWSPNR